MSFRAFGATQDDFITPCDNALAYISVVAYNSTRAKHAGHQESDAVMDGVTRGIFSELLLSEGNSFNPIAFWEGC